MANIILTENKEYVGEDIAQKAIEEIKKLQQEEETNNSQPKKGDQANEKVKPKSNRGRKKQSVQ